MQDFQIPAMGRQTFSLIRILGYCSLLLFLLDTCSILIPPRFTDSAWELNTYGQIVERVPLLLFSFPFIFFGEYSARGKWEQIATKVASWLTIGIAIFFFLNIPLGIVNTFRVQDIRQGDVIAKAAQQNGPVQEVAERLSKAKSDSEIKNVLRSINPQQQAAVAQISNPQEVKKKILEEISTSITKTQAQADESKRLISASLWKDTVKWSIGALFSGLFLLYIWMQSKWARVGIDY
jgi:hypothetical protein